MSSSSSDESMNYCQHYVKLDSKTCPTAQWMDPWNTLSKVLANALSVTLRNTIDLFQTGWWEWILRTFSVAMRKIRLTDENLWLVTLFALYQWPVFSPLLPSVFASHLYVPLFIPSSFFASTFTALFFPLLSTTPFAPLSQLLTSLCRKHYRTISQSCPGQQRRSGNESLPFWSSATWTSFITQFSGGRTE